MPSISQAVKNGCTQFVSSSGGNAGLSATYCAQQLGIPITVVVPKPTPDFIVELLKERGATVEVVGDVSSEVLILYTYTTLCTHFICQAPQINCQPLHVVSRVLLNSSLLF